MCPAAGAADRRQCSTGSGSGRFLPVSGHLAATKRKFVYFVKTVARRLGFRLAACKPGPGRRLLLTFPGQAKHRRMLLSILVCLFLLFCFFAQPWMHGKVQRETKTNHKLLYRANCLLCFLPRLGHKLCWQIFSCPPFSRCVCMCNICMPRHGPGIRIGLATPTRSRLKGKGRQGQPNRTEIDVSATLGGSPFGRGLNKLNF